MRIGIVDLDTSHPAAWLPIERELGHEIVGVWDGGSVHPPEYAHAFADKHGLPSVFETLPAMAAEVDCAIIHGCDWDTHLAKAQPFIEAGKSVLLDKPLAGNAADLREVVRLAENGVRITGGSSLRFCPEVQAFQQRKEAQDLPHTALCGCGVDDFNYGIHAYAMLSGIFGSGVENVQHLGTGAQRRIQVNYTGGRMGLLVIGDTAEWLPFYATVVTARGVEQTVVEIGGIYRSFLEIVLPYLAGEMEQSPMSPAALVEPELCALAAKLSWENNNRPVTLAEAAASAVRYDGYAFSLAYKKAKYP